MNNQEQEKEVVRIGTDWSAIAITSILCATVVAVVAILTNNP